MKCYLLPGVLTLLSIRAVECLASRSSDLAPFRQCEPIRIDMCRNIGYNETSMPNFVGMELQTDVEFTLQTFSPLIEYACSTQLKLFLCAAYVPMCTPKVLQPIGPCRGLCESVRSRCNPVLQGFGYPWPPALDCSRFPKENNYETMCMEGPGEAHTPAQEHHDIYPMNGLSAIKPGNSAVFDCPSLTNPHSYVKLHRSGRCAPLCEANILFGLQEKNLSEFWVTTWSYAALGLGLLATMCLIFSDDSKISIKWSSMLTPLIWCHDMVAIGWTVRFIAGRTATACGYDPQLPHVSLLLVDGLSNAPCAATFLLRYYFIMAACAWWSILCLEWHREVRRNSPDTHAGHFTLNAVCASQDIANKRNRSSNTKKRETMITQRNWARFVAWGLPAFQTAIVIVARLVDADELLGACFVGNQSDKSLQILVATPLFCYWIFGSMNLISGYLVHRRSKEIIQNANLQSLQHYQLNTAVNNSGLGTFLFIYCLPFAMLLLAVIYEFANIDVWLNVPAYITAKEGITTPLWPFLTRAFSELLLGQICFAWILGPKIADMCRRQMTPRPFKKKSTCTIAVNTLQKQPASSLGSGAAGAGGHSSGKASNIAYSTVSYQTINQAPQTTIAPQLSMKQISNYAIGSNNGMERKQIKCSTSNSGIHYKYNCSQKAHSRLHHQSIGHHGNKQHLNKVQTPTTHHLYTFGNETIL